MGLPKEGLSGSKGIILPKLLLWGSIRFFKGELIVRKRLSLLLILVMMMLLLAGCGSSKPQGTYAYSNMLMTGSVTFSKPDKITLSALGYDITGTYKINGSNIDISYEILNGVSTTISLPFSMKGNSVFISGQEFAKGSTPKS